MCVFCCEHNEGASCFYRRIFSRCTNRLESIEYVPGYGIIMPGLMTTNGIALMVYATLIPKDKVEFLEYMKQTFNKDRYEIFKKLVED